MRWTGDVWAGRTHRWMNCQPRPECAVRREGLGVGVLVPGVDRAGVVPHQLGDLLAVQGFAHDVPWAAAETPGAAKASIAAIAAAAVP